MHSHLRTTITRESARDGQEITTVTFNDGCSISFLSREGERWNGGAKTYRYSPGFLPQEIDEARNLAFPDRR